MSQNAIETEIFTLNFIIQMVRKRKILMLKLTIMKRKRMETMRHQLIQVQITLIHVQQQQAQ